MSSPGILLTGASGYVGGCLYAHIHPQVTVLQGRLEQIAPQSLDSQWVIHCAGALRAKHDALIESNVQGTEALLRGLKAPSKIVFISSRSVFSPQDAPIAETETPSPFDLYGESKYQAEQLIQKSPHQWLILRCGGIFGVGHHRLGHGFPDQAALRMSQGQTVTLFEPTPEHDFLYVQDLARVIQSLLGLNVWNQVFHLTGPRRPLAPLIEMIHQGLSSHFQVPALVHRQTPAPIHPVLSTEKLSRYLPQIQWTPDEVVVQEVVEYLKFLRGG